MSLYGKYSINLMLRKIELTITETCNPKRSEGSHHFRIGTKRFKAQEYVLGIPVTEFVLEGIN